MLTAAQRVLYDNLMNLCKSNDAFYYSDYALDDSTYRIFNYRLASYTDFLLSDALECRGIMFTLQADEPIRLASRTMPKFFNLYENPFTIGLDLSEIETIEHKKDGSLISTYLHDGQIRLKSKGSLFSDQALAAMDWLNLPEQNRFNIALYVFELQGYTINLEWISPLNRIVIGYPDSKLVVLNIRHRDSGEYLAIEKDDYLYQFTGNEVDTNGLSLAEFVNQIPTMLDDIEGFVVKMRSGMWVKVKTQKYLKLHHCKDSVNNPKRLWDAIIYEGIDDIRSLFHDDALVISTIDNMQVKVDHIYNTMVSSVEKFYADNKQLERKEYAIKAQREVPPLYFALVMNLYLNNNNDYKSFLSKNYKSFNIIDSSRK